MAVAAATLVWGLVCTAPGIPWNAARLAPSFALARGLPLYALRESGAHLGWVYGPVFPLWYLPMGWTDNPTVGLMLAALWNAVTVVVPLWLVTRIAAPRMAGMARFGTALGVILILADHVTRNVFLFLHVDVVSMAWAIVACVALHAAALRNWRPGMPIAAVAVALSVAAKQVSVVLVPATLAWLWWTGYRRLLGRWIFWLAVGCGSLAAVFFVVFGAEEMLFNAWLVFSRMPWQGGWEILWRNISQTMEAAWLWVLAAIAASAALRFRWREHMEPEARALAGLLLWLAVWQLPMGLMAAMIVDASLNSLHAIHYLMIAGLVAVASILSRGELAGRRLWPVLTGIAVIGVGTVIVTIPNADLVWTPYRGQEELVALARRHQGKIYLPWNPLTTVITEKKIYPFDEALHFMWMAGLEPPREAILAAVPAGAKILYQEPSQGHFALRYFGKDARPPAASAASGQAAGEKQATRTGGRSDEEVRP